MQRKIWLILAVTGLTACGGGGGSGGGNSAPAEPYTGTLTGTLVAPNGSTPIAGATLHISENDARIAIDARAAVAQDCPAPDNASEWTCSGADGQFSFEVTDLPPGSVLHARKGAWSLTHTLALNGSNPGQLGPVAFDNDTAAGAARIAVVTGDYDRIEDLLAKMGMGEIGSSGLAARSAAVLTHGHRHVHSPVTRSSLLAAPASLEDCQAIEDPTELCDCLQQELGEDFPCDLSGGDGLELGTETFDLYDGNGVLPASYPDVTELFASQDGQPRLFGYDIVYVNCGADLPDNVNWQTILQQFVAEGGVLYATDWASEWVEAFHGDVAPALTSGDTLETLNATVVDVALADWLANVTCAGGDCINGTAVTLAGFLSGWHLLKPLDETSVTPLVRADVAAYGFPGETSALMTYQFSHGDGQVIYSSYHTEPLSHADGYLPQERILEYLFFSQTP